MFQILTILGGVVLTGLGLMVCMAVVFAIPGNMPDTPAAKRLQTFLSFLIMATPIWEIVCLTGYIRGWVFGPGYAKLLWIPGALVPILFVFMFFAAAKRIQ